MPLSKHYLDTQEEPTPVDAEAIAKLLAVDFPQIGFAYLLGSAARGRGRFAQRPGPGRLLFGAAHF